MKGTVRVDFAGTAREAIAFVREHAPEFPGKLSTGRSVELTPNGDRAIYATFVGREQLAAVVEALARLGWAEEFQTQHRHDKKRGPR